MGVLRWLAVREDRRAEATREFPAEVVFTTGPVSVRARFLDWKPTTGGQSDGRGYVLLDDRGIWILGNLPIELRRAHMFIIADAGATFHAAGLALPGCAPLSPLDLVPDNRNPKDRNAVALFAGRSHIGYVPREMARKLGPMLRGPGPEWRGYVLWEYRLSGKDGRVGIRILVAPELALAASVDGG